MFYSYGKAKFLKENQMHVSGFKTLMVKKIIKKILQIIAGDPLIGI